MKTDDEIVLTIFGGERCVTTLADLEEIAKAIHQKAVRESETSANPSTFGGKIEAQISPLNAESDPSKTKTPKP
jgi:hypothetical protein